MLSFPNDSAKEITISLSARDTERLEHEIAARTSLDVSVNVKDVVLAIVREYFEHNDRTLVRNDRRPKKSQALFSYLFGGESSTALERLSEGIFIIIENTDRILEYDYCVTCGETIVAKRLATDPTIPTCITCAAKT